MDIRYLYVMAMGLVCVVRCPTQGKYLMGVPWTSYEAEEMKTTGTVLGPKYEPYQVETESSGQRCVKLRSQGQYIEFTASAHANAMVIRYSLPDKKEGGGVTATLDLYKNGRLYDHYPISSAYSRVYGKYPFTNDPDSGAPRNFYDELRIKDLSIMPGDIIRVGWNNRNTDQAEFCIIDLVDLENIAPPLKAPPHSLSVTDFQEDGDYTAAFRKCIDSAGLTGRTVWIPPGSYKITGDIVVPSNVTLQGAGMWYSLLTGDEEQYADVHKRVRIKGAGSKIHLADFAILGKLNYRSDKEANDGIVGSYGENSTISRLWIEHTKVGMWIENSKNLIITGCRLRNTMADGINFCVGMAWCTIEDCTARGTGDDCFAIWPAVFQVQRFSPGHNVIRRCMAQLPFLANGAAIYGGESNTITSCIFRDITQGSAILLSTTFPTEKKGINNNFSGTTVIENCSIVTSGGFDHEWDWRAALEICVDRRSISGVGIRNVSIINSLSNGLSVIARGGNSNLYNAVLDHVNIPDHGAGVAGKYGLFISEGAGGGLTMKNSVIHESRNESGNFIIYPIMGK